MSRRNPTLRRGLRWEPTNEQEVVMLFGRLLDHLPRPIVIDSIGTTFPDCRATDAHTNRPICIEFELNSSHFFRDHADRQEKCHWVVCWRDDAKRKTRSPRVIALDKIARRWAPDFILNRIPKSADRNERFRLKLAALPPKHRTIIGTLLEFDWPQHRLELVWPETDSEYFTVRERNGLEYFKVGARGTVGIPFSRWKGVPSTVRERLVSNLNSTFDTGASITSTGKKGREVGELFHKPARIHRFISVWTDFAARRADMRAQLPPVGS